MNELFRLKLSDAVRDEGDYMTWDDMGVEVEVAEFLYGLVRLLKPQLVVECGTGRGYAALAIASALMKNCNGHLITYEPMHEFRAEAEHLLAGLPAEVRPVQSCFDNLGVLPGLVFVDSAGEVRQDDLDYWLPRMQKVVVHDSREYVLPEDGFEIDTTRGLWVRL